MGVPHVIIIRPAPAVSLSPALSFPLALSAFSLNAFSLRKLHGRAPRKFLFNFHRADENCQRRQIIIFNIVRVCAYFVYIVYLFLSFYLTVSACCVQAILRIRLVSLLPAAFSLVCPLSSGNCLDSSSIAALCPHMHIYL